jgi:hypothetical protein
MVSGRSPFAIDNSQHFLTRPADHFELLAGEDLEDLREKLLSYQAASKNGTKMPGDTCKRYLDTGASEASQEGGSIELMLVKGHEMSPWN